MKNPLLFLTKPAVIAVSLLLAALAIPEAAWAKPDKKGGSSSQSKKSKSKSNSKSKSKSKPKSSNDNDRRGNDHESDRDDHRQADRRDDGRYDDHSGHEHDQARSHYHSRPRTTFSLNLGTGYAGRGYYYGPPGVPYYYERPEVRYYRTRESAPREYWGQENRTQSVEASVQQALAREGYYQGPIDGQIGPYSRQVIAQYQEDRGLRPTGLISSSLLRSLGLQE